MKIKKEELKSILSKVKSIAMINKEFEKANTFTFTKNKIIVYTDEVAVIFPFKSEFSFTVLAEEFYGIISDIKKKEIDITMIDNKLIFKAGKTKSELQCEDSNTMEKYIDTLELKELKKGTIKLPEDFIEALKLCIPASANDSKITFLNCLHIDNNKVVSSDDLRISMYKMKGVIKGNFLIKSKDVRKLLGFDITKYYLGKSWICFSTDDDIVFALRLVEDEFPDLEDNFKFQGGKVILPDEMKDSVKLVSNLAEGDSDLNRRIEVTILKDKIKLRGEKDIGWIEDYVPFDSKRDKDIKFNINPVFFLDILGRTNIMKVGEDRAMFEMENFQHLMALYYE